MENAHNLTMEERNFCDEPKTMAVIHMLIHLALDHQYVKSAKNPGQHKAKWCQYILPVISPNANRFLRNYYYYTIAV